MSSDALRELTTLCQQLRNAEAELADIDTNWKAKKATVQHLTEEDIPALMTELGVRKITLGTGELIEVKPDIEASIPKEDAELRAKAFAWIEDNGHGSIIKTIVAVQFGRDELAEAHQLMELLAYLGYMSIMDRAVHASTLKSFLKERLAEGDPVPLEYFLARPFQKAKIK